MLQAPLCDRNSECSVEGSYAGAPQSASPAWGCGVGEGQQKGLPVSEELGIGKAWRSRNGGHGAVQ